MQVSETSLRKLIRKKLISEASQRYTAGEDLSSESVYTRDIKLNGKEYGPNKKYSNDVYFIAQGKSELGAIQRTGDPFTYEEVSGGDWKVVSAPESKKSSIGEKISVSSQGKPDASGSQAAADMSMGDDAGEIKISSGADCRSLVSAAKSVGAQIESNLKEYYKIAKAVHEVTGDISMPTLKVAGKETSRSVSDYLGWKNGIQDWGIPNPKAIQEVREKIDPRMSSANLKVLDKMTDLVATLDADQKKWQAAVADAHACTTKIMEKIFFQLYEKAKSIPGADPDGQGITWNSLNNLHKKGNQAIIEAANDAREALAPHYLELIAVIVKHPSIELGTAADADTANGRAISAWQFAPGGGKYRPYGWMDAIAITGAGSGKIDKNFWTLRTLYSSENAEPPTDGSWPKGARSFYV